MSLTQAQALCALDMFGSMSRTMLGHSGFIQLEAEG